MSDANALKEELAEVLGGLRRYKKPFPAMFGIAPGEFFTLGMIEMCIRDSSYILFAFLIPVYLVQKYWKEQCFFE